MDQKMFCYQCQETAGCKGCTVVGVCGKQQDVAAMQDLLVWVTKGICAVTTRLREEGRAVADEVNHLVTENLFTTITNANFDKVAIEKRIEKTLEMKTALWEQLERRDNLPEAAGWTGEPSEFIKKASEAGVLIGQNEDIISLRSLITYGLKGLSAYTRHANVLLQEDREADAFLQRALAATLDDGLSVDCLLYTSGIKLFGGVSGDADKAVEAFINDTLDYNPDVKCSQHEHSRGEGHTCGEHGCGNHSCH